MEVNLKKESWHFKLNKWSQREEPRHWSLCPYFWLTVWNLIIAPLRLPFRAAEWLGDRFIKGSRVEGVVNRTLDRVIMADTPVWMQKIDRWFDRNSHIIRKIVLTVLLLFLVSLFTAAVIFEGWLAFLKFLCIILVALAMTVGTALVTVGLDAIKHSEAWKMLKGMWRSFMDKACPGIIWE